MRSQRIAAASGAIYVILIMIGSGMATGNGDPQDGPTILAHLRQGRSAAETAGVLMEVLSFAALLVFLGYLYRVLRRAEGAQASQLHPNQLTPDLARTLNDLGGAGFVISGYLFGIFVAVAAGSAVASRGLPRWLSISGLVIGVLTLAAGAAGILEPSGYVPVPYLLCLAWVLVTSIVLAVRGRQPIPATANRAVDAVQAGTSATA
jgi:hypothetical protein